MSHTEERAATESAMDKMRDEVKGYFGAMVKKIDAILAEREAKENLRMEQLLSLVSSQLNKNLSALLEAAIQKELKSQVFQRIGKAMTSKIDARLGEMLNGISATNSASLAKFLESKGMQEKLSESVKENVARTLVPVVEDGINEMRLQFMDYVKTEGTLQKVEEIREMLRGFSGMARSEEGDDFTLTDLADALRMDEGSEEEPLRKKEEIEELLETNVYKCFEVVLDSACPDLFSHFLEILSPLHLQGLPNNVLISFIQQLVTINGGKWSEDKQAVSKSLSLLYKSLMYVNGGSLTEQEAGCFKRIIDIFKAVDLRVEKNSCDAVVVDGIMSLLAIHENYINGRFRFSS
jgi:hypothetical protein